MSEPHSSEGTAEGTSVSRSSEGGSDDEDSKIRLYFWGGIIAAIISWVVVPIVGLVAVYCGWKVYQMKSEIQGGIIAGVGGIGVLVWLLFLLGM